MKRKSAGWVANVSLGLLFGLLALCGPHSVIAADWAPTEKITLVTHASPGTGIDVFVREIADIWARHRIVERLHDEFAAVLRMSDVAEAFARAGAEPVSSTPREFEAYLRSEVARWTKVIKEAGVKVE